jgi:YidC/Oxa1 family membrane protein insertase
MLLILGYQVLFEMPRMKARQEALKARRAQEALERAAPGDTVVIAPEADTTVTPAGDKQAAEPLPTANVLDAGLPTAASAETERRITVRTPLYDVVLSSAGADMVSVRLAQFKTAGQPVELVSHQPAGAADGIAEVAILTEAGQLALSGVAFDAFSDRSVSPLEDGAVLVLDADRPQLRVSFRTAGAGGGVERYYTFAHDSYVVGAGVRFNAADLPSVRSIRWGLGPGVQPTEANVREDEAAERATVRLGEEYYRKKRGSFDESYSGTVHWVSLQLKYFIVALMAPAPVGGEARIEGRKADGFMTGSIDLPVFERQGRVDQTVEMYMGPIDFDALKSLGRGLEKNVDLGHKYFRPVSAAVLWSLLKLHTVIPNYGLVIILLSVFTKVLFYRLTHKSFKSMRDMQALQPRLQGLKEKYKNDRAKLSQETMKIYKEAGVNPLGGCLPMLLQMPVFIALFNVLRNTIELRQAPFVGWINDLSQQDVLATLPMALPMLGDAVSVLPIVMGASMLLQSRIGGSIAGPESSATQSKMLQYMMPIVFTVLFYRMPSGLVIYWIVNTVLSIAQQYYINKGVDKAQREKEVESAGKQEGTTKQRKNGQSKT